MTTVREPKRIKGRHSESKSISMRREEQRGLHIKTKRPIIRKYETPRDEEEHSS